MADNANKDAHDTQNTIKSEFYTREGLWTSLRHSEYTKPYATSTTTAIGNTNAQSAIQCVYNNTDQVKLSFIRLASHMDNNGCVRIRCIHCNKLNSPDMSNKVNVPCESCNHTLKLTHENADYLMFNYSKELYLYYFNGINEVSVDFLKIFPFACLWNWFPKAASRQHKDTCWQENVQIVVCYLPRRKQRGKCCKWVFISGCRLLQRRNTCLWCIQKRFIAILQ